MIELERMNYELSTITIISYINTVSVQFQGASAVHAAITLSKFTKRFNGGEEGEAAGEAEADAVSRHVIA